MLILKMERDVNSMLESGVFVVNLGEGMVEKTKEEVSFRILNTSSERCLNGRTHITAVCLDNDKIVTIKVPNTKMGDTEFIKVSLINELRITSVPPTYKVRPGDIL